MAETIVMIHGSGVQDGIGKILKVSSKVRVIDA